MFTQEQYNALCEAIAQGALIVQYSDKRVEYRSLDEMLQIKSMMEQQLGLGQYSQTFQGTRRVGVYSKGT